MDKKLFLTKYRQAYNRIKVLQNRKSMKREELTYLSAVQYGDGIHSSFISDPTANKALNFITITEEIDSEISELKTKMVTIRTVVRRLSNLRYRSVIELRYIDGLSLKEIQDVLDIPTIQQVTKLINKAMRVLPITEEEYNTVFNQS